MCPALLTVNNNIGVRRNGILNYFCIANGIRKKIELICFLKRNINN